MWFSWVTFWVCSSCCTKLCSHNPTLLHNWPTSMTEDTECPRNSRCYRTQSSLLALGFMFLKMTTQKTMQNRAMIKTPSSLCVKGPISCQKKTIWIQKKCWKNIWSLRFVSTKTKGTVWQNMKQGLPVTLLESIPLDVVLTLSNCKLFN